ncbi:hypothetical protein A3F08_02130 [Candidatus Berkelbacteria bacterium RIFCSPHIGHO2_12_FULL_36_9]|uniref:PilN domain-containing protein n=1 Tax=Candidatus Berkelbacteria bacterium RIFCSPHIGHO2_12_FULL_36_9 TaxID=1797469 RepID=A0A1F5EDC4_9BACT|nr:MAG: hypothetical protein A3F08_02130 [Candidatus Berkelbacteria bacterium RIFCSPHIGHO2_12_FULL_36_9]
MIKINLLPMERKEKTKTAKQNLGFLIIVLSIFIILGIILVVLIAVNYTIKTSYEGTQNNIKSTKETLKTFSDIKDEILFIKDRLRETDNLKNKKTSWSNQLQDLAGSTPSTIRLTNFIINTSSKPEIKISGLTQTRSDIIKFKEQLETTNNFKDVLFESSKKITVEEKEYFDFTLLASIEGK